MTDFRDCDFRQFTPLSRRKLEVESIDLKRSRADDTKVFPIIRFKGCKTPAFFPGGNAQLVADLCKAAKLTESLLLGDYPLQDIINQALASRPVLEVDLGLRNDINGIYREVRVVGVEYDGKMPSSKES